MIFPLKEPCPGKCLVIVVSRIELRSFAYSLLELYCLKRFVFFWALGFSGLALKMTGVFFCLDDVRVVISVSSSDDESSSDVFCLWAGSWVTDSLWRS